MDLFCLYVHLYTQMWTFIWIYQNYSYICTQSINQTMANKIKLVAKAETEKEVAHTDVYVNNVFVGYITRNKSNFAQVGENWNFTNKIGGASFHDKTKQKLIEKIFANIK